MVCVIETACPVGCQQQRQGAAVVLAGTLTTWLAERAVAGKED